MAKVFTSEAIRNDINELINTYVGENDTKTAFVQSSLRASFDMVPALYNIIEDGILEIFQHPENAETEIAAFRTGIHMTCPFYDVAEAMADIYAELASDFCFG